MTHPGYPIRAAAKLAGLTPDTLRAWERRYRAVVPARGQRGRLYSEAQVSRLRWLRDAVSAGHAIGQVASLSDQDIRGLLNRQRASEGGKKRGKATEAVHEHTLARVMGCLLYTSSHGARIDFQKSGHRRPPLIAICILHNICC